MLAGFVLLFLAFQGFYLGLIIIPIDTIITRNNPIQLRERVQNYLRRYFTWFYKLMVILGLIKVKFSGFDRINYDKSAILIANHPSYIDYLLITSQLKRCDCIAKDEIWHNPFMKYVVQGAGYIPNTDDNFLDLWSGTSSTRDPHPDFS